MKVFVFDPTIRDDMSKVRGIGRYLQILRENFKDEFKFISNIGYWKLGIGNWSLDIGNSVFINPFFNFLQPPLTMFRIAKKQVAVIHDLIPLKYPEHFPVGLKGKLNIFLNKIALRNYDIIITDSEASKRDIINILGLPEGKIKVVYPCLPSAFTNLKFEVRNLKSSSNEQMFKKLIIGNLDLNKNFKFQISNYCLYVGDATWNKNLVNIARAIKLADVPCVFVGKIFNAQTQIRGKKTFSESQLSEQVSPEEALALRVRLKDERSRLTRMRVDLEENFSSRNNFHPWQKELHEFLSLAKDDKRFIFPGFVPDNELMQLYEQASLNILLSRDEGFGFSYVEAGSLGCPSLLSERPIFHEIAGTAAQFVDLENINQIAEAIKQYINDPEKRRQLGSKAQEQSRLYSQEQFKKVFLNAIS